MGCASSAPLVEQGKNLVESAKDTANESISKGEKALQDTGDTIKDGLESVKDSVHIALNSAEESIGSVAQKIGDTFNFATSRTSENMAHDFQDAKEALSSKDDLLTSASDAATEAVSEAETVVMSETDHAREAFQTAAAPFFETVHSLEEGGDTALKDPEEDKHAYFSDILEDLEGDSNKDLLGESVGNAKREIVEELNDVEQGHGDKDKDKEEPPPTFWEAAADAILMKKVIKGMEMSPQYRKAERIFFTPPEKPDVDSSEKSLRENDLVVENADN
ncbi:protein DR_1172 isoform X2 [Euwallacea fornicatus]|uniref:protein DR_1172 isoform X2 n=1 Tax=Euwallacea fornicatus TaxID=995702 RepID=UPI00338F8AEC